MNGQSHDPYALSSGKNFRITLKPVRPISKSDSFGERINTWHPPDFKPSTVQPVAYLNSLSSTLQFVYKGTGIQNYNLTCLCGCKNWYNIKEIRAV
jgi:hypothetical protein